MKRIAMMVSTIAMALALTACGGEEQKATTWSESHYEKAQETQGAFAYAEDAEPEKWLIVKFQGQWLITGDYCAKNQMNAGSTYHQTLKTFERCSDGVIRIRNVCADIVEIRTDVEREEDAYAETSAPARVDADTQYVVVLHVPEEASE